MLSKILTILGLAAAGLLFIVFTTTKPSSGAAVILAVFLLGYITALCAFTFILRFVSIFLSGFYQRMGRTNAAAPLSLRKSYYYSSVIALAPIIIISLKSVGEVGVYELILIGLFVFLGCVYVARRADS